MKTIDRSMNTGAMCFRVCSNSFVHSFLDVSARVPEPASPLYEPYRPRSTHISHKGKLVFVVTIDQIGQPRRNMFANLRLIFAYRTPPCFRLSAASWSASPRRSLATGLPTPSHSGDLENAAWKLLPTARQWMEWLEVRG